jgi:hypothetical protein
METYLIEFNTFEKPKILKILEALDIKFSKINQKKEAIEDTSYTFEDYKMMLEDSIQSENSIVFENNDAAFQYLMKR